MENSLDFITGLGFKYAGKWVSDDKKEIKFEPNVNLQSTKKNLYAFVVDENVKYIGKTSRTLDVRMGNYRTCVNKRQYTNLRIRNEIIEVLKNHDSVSVYVLSNNDINFNDVNLNKEEKEILSLITFTAGLEDGLIEKLKLKELGWNKN